MSRTVSLLDDHLVRNVILLRLVKDFGEPVPRKIPVSGR